MFDNAYALSTSCARSQASDAWCCFVQNRSNYRLYNANGGVINVNSSQAPQTWAQFPTVQGNAGSTVNVKAGATMILNSNYVC